jgi:predicted nucleic acid-binding protein
MGIKYLWDTNIVIYYLQQQFSWPAEKFIDKLLTESTPAFSVITELELLCWKTTDEKDRIVLKKFISNAKVFELDTPIKLKTVDLRKSTKIKLPDAIIAATASTYGITLLTSNVKDFKNIDNLSLLNPQEL